MKNFLRAVQFALRYRGRLAISIFCAFIAAALFGLNFSIVYPVLQLLDKKQNLQEWVDGRIQTIENEIVQRETEIDNLEAEQRQATKWADPSARRGTRADHDGKDSIRAGPSTWCLC